LLSVKPADAESRNLRDVEGIREEVEMRNRRDTGDLVKFIGVIGIIAVMSIVVGAALIGSSSVAAVMPDWRQASGLHRGGIRKRSAGSGRVITHRHFRRADQDGALDFCAALARERNL
jgi:hypothetical protein